MKCTRLRFINSVATDLAARPKPPSKDPGGHLHQRAVFHPGLQLIEARMQQGVAFGVGNDGGESGPLEAVEDFLGGTRNEQVGEFDQEIGEVIDGVLGGMGQSVLNVLESEMEVAAAVDARAGGRRRPAVLRFSRAIRTGSKANWVLAWGVATMSVVPESAARRNMATESSRVLAPSSRPDKIWLWISTTSDATTSGSWAET